MKKYFLICLLLIVNATIGRAQVNVANLLVKCPDSTCWGFRGKIADDGIHRYDFGIPFETPSGNYYTPAINGIYFVLPKPFMVDSFSMTDSFPVRSTNISDGSTTSH